MEKKKKYQQKKENKINFIYSNLVENKYVNGLSKILDNTSENIEGNLICNINSKNYTIKKNWRKISNIQYLCKNKKKIMEIGVNACHSLLIMLLENPTAEYLLFDLNNHKYTESCINYIKENFPKTKINIIYGNSVETVTEYILNNQNELNSYDLIHIDGGHTKDIFNVDFDNSKKLISNDGIVIFDDYNLPEIKSFINNKIINKNITKYKDLQLTKSSRHFIYKY